MIIFQDITGAIPEGYAETMSDALAHEALRAIAAQARDFWIQAAQENLQDSALDYINAIQEPRPVAGRALAMEISLVGALAGRIENGEASYDMRDTLLGPKVPVVARGSGMKGKYAKKGGGFYRAIPFSHQAPHTAGVNGVPIGRPYARHPDVANVQAMAQAIYKAAQKLAPTTGTGKGKITYGGRLPAGMAPKLKPHHKTDIYAGMVRQQKTYAKATQSTLTTFRMISTGSPGWIRKAVPGRYLALKVSREVQERIAPSTFDYIFRQKR